MNNRAAMALASVVAISAAVLAGCIWACTNAGTQQPAENEPENVDLQYLAGHMEEFENKKVMVTGVTDNIMVVEPPFHFWIEGVEVLYPGWMNGPLEGGPVTVTGTVVKIRENYYAISAESVISAESWTVISE